MGRVNQMPAIGKYSTEPILKETIIKDHYVITKSENEKLKAMISALPKVGYDDGWFPTMKQAEELTNNLPESYDFLLWIMTSNEELSEEEDHQEVTDYIGSVLSEKVFVA